MKIALPSRNKQIDSHFGHCEYFTVYTIDENKKIVDEQTVTSPAGCGCKSNIAKTLADQGVKTYAGRQHGRRCSTCSKRLRY